MSVFKLPRILCQDISAIMAKFWWGNKIRERGVSLEKFVSGWNIKNWGGTWISRHEDFNTALLAKQCWKFLQQPESLVARVFWSKYFGHNNILEATTVSSSSFIWKSISSTLGLLREGLLWRVGDGKMIKIWQHKWIPKESSFKIQSPVKVSSKVIFCRNWFYATLVFFM